MLFPIFFYFFGTSGILSQKGRKRSRWKSSFAIAIQCRKKNSRAFPAITNCFPVKVPTQAVLNTVSRKNCRSQVPAPRLMSHNAPQYSVELASNNVRVKMAPTNNSMVQHARHWREQCHHLFYIASCLGLYDQVLATRLIFPF